MKKGRVTGIEDNGRKLNIPTTDWIHELEDRIKALEEKVKE